MRTRTVENQIVDYEFASEYIARCDPFTTVHRGKDDMKQTENNKALNTKPIAAQSNVKVIKKKLSKSEPKTLQENIPAQARMRRGAPKYVLLTGLPASGESTFANRLSNEWQSSVEKKRNVVIKARQKIQNGWLFVNSR